MANVIAHYIERVVDLLTLPHYCSYILQALDVSVFSLLKRAFTAATDGVARLDASSIFPVEWTHMYVRVIEKVLTATNIRAISERPCWCFKSTLDFILLNSSQPDGTEVRKLTALSNSEL